MKRSEFSYEIEGDYNLIIKNSNGNTFSININDPKDIQNLIISFGEEMRKLPEKIQEIMVKNKIDDENIKGTRLYLTFSLEMSDTQSTKLRPSTVITNLNRDHRYYNTPYFKIISDSDLPREFLFDTFQLFQIDSPKTVYPIKLEFGQPVTSYFNLSDEAIAMLRTCPDDTKLKAYVSSTIGELIESNEELVHDFIKNYDEIYSR